MLQNCTGEFRVYHGMRRDPCTPDLTSQTYLPVVGRKNKPQSAVPYVANVNSSSFKKTGRAARRVRRKHRLQLRPLRSCTIATVNTQGLNWMKIAHQDKLEILLELRRKYNWDVTCLTEIHNTDVPTGTNQYQMVFVQETLCILGRAAGIVLGHAARQAWEKSGRKVRVLHDRILGILLQSCGGLSWIYSIYAPTGVTAAQYDEFLSIIENNIITKHEDLSEAFYLVGDWNAHIGRDSKNDKVTIGPHTMRQCTSARGKTLEKWLRSQQLTKTDTHFYVPRRGTWQHNITKHWYELDGMVTPIGTHRRVQRIRTRPTAALSDHNAKEFYVHFTTLASTTRRQQRRQRFQAHDHRKQHKNRIRYDLLQGPISGDTKKHYRDRLDELLCEEGILLPQPTKNDQEQSGLHWPMKQCTSKPL